MKFVSLCWPQMRLYGKQRDVLLSVRDNAETFVHAANETGKTRTAAIAAIWFFSSRTPARVIFSSSSETQLKAILWSEIDALLRCSRLSLPFVCRTPAPGRNGASVVASGGLRATITNLRTIGT